MQMGNRGFSVNPGIRLQAAGSTLPSSLARREDREIKAEGEEDCLCSQLSMGQRILNWHLI